MFTLLCYVSETNAWLFASKSSKPKQNGRGKKANEEINNIM